MYNIKKWRKWKWKNAFESYVQEVLDYKGYFVFDDYINFVTNEKDNYLHLQLLNYAYDNGYLSDENFGLDYVNLVNIISDYFNFKNIDVNVERCSNSNSVL